MRAIVADMDGVITRTARQHERAWKEMFDEYLAARGRRDEGRQEPFSSEDYRRFVDGKPRHDGVRDFLASRGLEIPDGDPSDPPDRETICGLGNRKNEIFLALLDREGVEVFEDAVRALDRWRRAKVPLAVVSASRNCRRVLRAAGLEGRFDAVVDGQTAEELGLRGKQALMTEAARRLGVEPGDAVVFEDATAGVRAARRAQFGRVIGVDRDGRGRALREAGADDVVSDLCAVTPR